MSGGSGAFDLQREAMPVEQEAMEVQDIATQQDIRFTLTPHCSHEDWLQTGSERSEQAIMEGINQGW